VAAAGALIRLLLSLVIGHVVADNTSAGGTEKAVMTGKMARHAAHHRALYAALRMRRRTSQAHRHQAGGRGYWKQKGFHGKSSPELGLGQ
jgi:hypothetical protein